MLSQWNDDDARAAIQRWTDGARVNEDVALRVYSSRLLGRDPRLVLHGGGNTSVKTRLVDDTGEEVDVLCVKGSGWDLASIEPAGLPALRLASLGKLRARESLTDEEMVNAQRTRLLDASAPNPSVETLLHAFLPAKFIDHTHADAILAIVDQPDAERLCREIFGARLAVVPYVMPGFALSKLAAEVQEAHPEAEGLLLLRHGLFTWGATARESYERHIDAVRRAEAYIEGRRAAVAVPREAPPPLDFVKVAPLLRGALGDQGRRYVLHRRCSSEIDAYLARTDLHEVSQRGTPTPDHVIRTKRLPMLLRLDPSMDAAAMRASIAREVAAYREAYRAYVAREAAAKGREVVPLDPDPRVVLVPGLGVVAVGTSERAARIVADLHEHGVAVIEAAEAVGRYEVLDPSDVFDMEYWSLEQAKLGRRVPRPLDGQIVYVSGAAGGIGEATARRFRAAGAHLFLVDRDAEALARVAADLGAAHLVLDVRDAAAVEASVSACVARFGGLDGVVSNAGVAPSGRLDEVEPARFRDSLEVNLVAHQTLAAAATRVMRTQGVGGFLLFNASKAAFNPGQGFGPYAVAKAALVALMKQYAVDQGEAGIRANAINADRVRTGLLPPEFVAERAAARGLSPQAYFRSNLLGREVTVDDCAEAFLALALARATTGCVLTVDGGNIAAAPR